ncbi:hypothetical protein GCM10009560_40110 [Nonomuraea longicatena]|uniref:ABC transporter domain-containing protein n=1 Tax=Nonomuraea longicatena TaxID=83682 RepID=A0ABP4AB09_9ACTN
MPAVAQLSVKSVTKSYGTRTVLDQGTLAELDGVRVGERLRLDGLLAIEPGQRLLITGGNGAGKTTLLRVLAGDLEPDAGTARRTQTLTR